MPTIQVTPDEDTLLQGIADALLKARKVVVVTGAGISTNSGIPDFRSENGLYSLIQAQLDAAIRKEGAGARRLSSSDASIDDEPEREQERPVKRRKLSFEDSGICLTSESSQTSSDQETSTFRGKSSFSGERANGPTGRRGKGQKVEESREYGTSGGHIERRATPVSSEASLRRSRRAQSFPPSPPEDVEHPLRGFPAPVHLSSGSPTRGSLRIRGRSASPGTRRLHATQANSAELRKRSLLTSSRVTMQATETDRSTRFASSPLRPPRAWSGNNSEETGTRTDEAPTTGQTATHLTTPKASKYKLSSSSPLSSPPSDFLLQTPPSGKVTDCFARSNLSLQALNSSSPLSSPPPILFDPYVDQSSSTSRQSSSVASSAASSETDETPPSSYPNKPSLPNIKGRDLFDASVWSDPLRTSVFYTFATTLRQKVKNVQPTESHHFIGHLRNRGKLVRCYTQNIDQIEEKVGLSTSLQEGPGHRGRFSRRSTAAAQATTPPNSVDSNQGTVTSVEVAAANRDTTNAEDGETKQENAISISSVPTEPLPQQQEKRPSGVECVFLHGSLESLRCFQCGKICAWDEDGRANETLSGRQPECPYCVGATAAREERGKRRLGVGKLRPDIVLYGEEHPSAHLISPIITHDLGLYPDLLLILGTSLKVHGLKVLVREFAKTIHSKGGKVVFVNFTKPPESSWGDIIDYWVQWDCDAWVSNLKDRIPLMWLPPGTKLPKKKKEANEKARRRQSQPNADNRTKCEAPKPLGKVGSSLAPSATDTTAPPGNPETMENSPTPGMTANTVKQSATSANPPEPRQHEPVPATSKDVANDEAQAEPVSKVQSTQKPKPAGNTPPKPTASRPMAVRDDKTNAAWLSWKVLTELRRIAGTQPPVSYSPTTLRVTKTKPKKPRKSAPAKLAPVKLPQPQPQPQLAVSNDSDNAPAPPEPHEGLGSVHQGEAMQEQAQSEGSMEDVPMVEVGASSIFAAVKLNPRKRKRKTIDGVEVSITGTPRSVSVGKTLPRSGTQKAKTPARNEEPLVVSPKILCGLDSVPINSFKLPPLQKAGLSNTAPPKLPALEPAHAPMGPLVEISHNSQIRIERRATREQPFYYCDVLINQLLRAPDWTRPQFMQGGSVQLRAATNLAMTTEGPKDVGSRTSYWGNG